MRKVLARSFSSAVESIYSFGESHPPNAQLEPSSSTSLTTLSGCEGRHQKQLREPTDPHSAPSTQPQTDEVPSGVEAVQPDEPRDPHSAPSTLPQVDDLPSEVEVVRRLIESGRGSESLRFHFHNSAEISVSDLVFFIDNPNRPLSRGFVDGLFGRLTSTRARRVSERVWELMTRQDTPSQTRFARMIGDAIQGPFDLILIPLFVTDSDWVLVAAFFSGAVRIISRPSLPLRFALLQEVRKLLTRFLRVPIVSLEVLCLAESSTQTQVELLRTAALLFNDPRIELCSQGHSAAAIDFFTRSVVRLALGKTELVFA